MKISTDFWVHGNPNLLPIALENVHIGHEQEVVDPRAKEMENGVAPISIYRIDGK